MLEHTNHEELAFRLSKLRDRRNKRGRKSQIIIGIIVAIAIIAGATVFYYRQAVYEPLDPLNKETTSVIIKKDTSISTLADSLEEKEIIKSSEAFYWYIRLNGLAETIISGRFKVSPSMTVPEIVATISDASKSEAILTIKEGERIIDIDKNLTEMGLIQAGDFAKAVKTFASEDYEFYPFLDKKYLTSPITNPNGNTIILEYPLEGFLFPDTYFLDPTNFSSTNLVYKCLNNFKKKTEEVQDQISKSKRSLEEIITVASILEKEVKTMEDRQIVAGILWKRLDSSWRLDADATLLYTKADYKITTADLASDNPYNTRKFKGLPPGPIGNPSLNSIKAALNPKTTDYWFYLSASDGTTVFAKTNDEQNANKGKYL